ncbi:aminotransferase class IV [Chelatococcus sp. GCM10030263]|uniref:aminotransferase class IV n=1 Tax=Chelatococcus sp. GCM10030263 TaxID=3273387 RepID=UPI003620C47F
MLWLNGEIHDGPVAPFDLRDRGLLLADGLFETILAVNGVALCLADHLDRMEAGAARLALPLDRAVLETAVAAVAAGAENRTGVVRLTVTRGPGQRGLRVPADARPTVLATIAPWRPEIAFSPLRLALVTLRRNPFSPVSTMKTLAYLDNVLALEEAAAKGGEDALILNTAGHVASTSMANLFALLDGRLVTPPVDDGVLPGVTRKLILALAPGLGLAVAERSLAPKELGEAEAVFATNSVRLLAPVSAIDGTAIRHHTVIDALSQALREALARACGFDPFAKGS